MTNIKICTVVTGANISMFLNNLAAIQEQSNFIELRVDHIQNLKVNDINIIAQHTHQKAIFTCRHQNEGGNYTGDRGSQLKIIDQAINLKFDYIDIDLKVLKFKKINNGSSQLIVSHHNFTSTTSLAQLTETLNQMRETQAEIFKIATMVNNEQDNFTLMKLLLKRSTKEKLIVLGMGEKGKITRILSPLLGAYLTFASTPNTSSAHGQIYLSELKQIYKLIESQNDKTKFRNAR